MWAVCGHHPALPHACTITCKEDDCSVCATGHLVQTRIRLEGEKIRLELTSRDCGLLIPDSGRRAAAGIKHLRGQLALLESEGTDADAQHRLYTLLLKRTECVEPLSTSLAPLCIHAGLIGRLPTWRTTYREVMYGDACQ